MTAKSQTTTLPEFASYEEEARFWDTHNLTDFGEMKAMDIEFKPRLNRSLNVRFASTDVHRLRTRARNMGVHVSTLVRVIVRQHLQTGERVQAASS